MKNSKNNSTYFKGLLWELNNDLNNGTRYLLESWHNYPKPHLSLFGYSALFCIREMPHLLSGEYKRTPDTFPSLLWSGVIGEIGMIWAPLSRCNPHSAIRSSISGGGGGRGPPQSQLSGVSPCALLCRFPKDWEHPHPSKSITFLLGDNSWCLGCCLLSPKASILPSFLLTEAGWLGWQCAQIKIFIFLDSCSQGWKPLGGAPGKA